MGRAKYLQQSKFDIAAPVAQDVVEFLQNAQQFHAVYLRRSRQNFQGKQLKKHHQLYFVVSMIQSHRSLLQCHLENSFEQRKVKSYTSLKNFNHLKLSILFICRFCTHRILLLFKLLNEWLKHILIIFIELHQCFMCIKYGA